MAPLMTSTMSALIASISPLAIPTPPELTVQPAPLPAPPSSRKRGMRLSLASLLEPDLEAKVFRRLRGLTFDKRAVAASSLAFAGSWVWS